MPNDIAIADLDELTSQLKRNIDNGGFDNTSVMWLIKAWTKIAILTNGPGIHKRMAGYLVMKRDPTKTSGKSKRSMDLLRSLEDYESMVEKNGTTGGDFFNRADKAMLDFVWEYRKAITGLKEDAKTGEKDFVSRIQQWMNLTEDQVMKQVVFNMDRG
jgi:hypothetical protein